MKTILITIIGLALLSSLCDAQTTVQKTTDGNYTAVKKAQDTSKSVQVATFTDSKGNVWPVYKSASGRLYALRTSKIGNSYKMYIKEN